MRRFDILVLVLISLMLTFSTSRAQGQIPDFENKTYYADLELKSSATPEDIESSWKKLRRQYHPDLNKDPTAESKFKTVKEAYEVLSNPQKRAQYDSFVFLTKSRARVRSWLWGLFGWALENANPPPPPRESPGAEEPPPPPPRDTFKDTHNEGAFLKEWQEMTTDYLSVPGFTPGMARVRALSLFIQMILKDKADIFSHLRHKEIMSGEINKFVRTAWTSIQEGDLTGTDLHKTTEALHSLYLALNALREVQKKNEVEFLTDIPRYVLRTAFVTAETDRERAIVVAHSNVLDLGPEEFLRWLEPYSWYHRFGIIHEMDLRVKILNLDPSRVVNYGVWYASFDELKGPGSQFKRLILRCSEFLGQLPTKLRLDRAPQNNK